MEELKRAFEKYKSAGAKYLPKMLECSRLLYDGLGAEGYSYVLEVRSCATKAAKAGESIETALDVVKQSYQISARDHFEDYLLFVEWDRPYQSKFYQPRRKQLKVVVDALQDLADDKLDLLTISMPPGTGKSATAIFFLTWLAGRKPEQSILGGSHNTAFLRGVYDECMRIIKGGGEYLWGDAFRMVELAKTNAQDLLIDLGKPKRFSTLEFTSIGSGNAGKVRATQLLYCDDLCSGIEEAMSKERLDTLWTKYTTDLKQRKMGLCKELHIATRWSVHDVIGRLERENEGNSRARFICMPALDENDESNFDYGGAIGFSTEFFKEMRDVLDPASWKALYMNQPVEREGLLYDPDTLRYFYELPDVEPDALLAVCDPAEGGGDDTFMPVFAVYGDDHYCFDCVCSDALPEVTDGLLIEALVRNDVQMCQFESNAAGGRTADKVQDGVKAKGGKTHITKKRTLANKETKIIVNSPFVKEHVLFLDPQMYKRGSMYGKMMEKLCSYTVAGRNKHDDVPDGFAQYALFVQNMGGNRAEIVKRPF